MIPTLFRRSFVSISMFRNSAHAFRSSSVFRSSLTNNWSIGCPMKEFGKKFPLTEREAFAFVEDVLEIPEASKKLENNRKQFLDEFTKQWYRRIPFSMIKYQNEFIAPHNGFKFPTFHETKDALFSRFGGGCAPLNCFTQPLLSHLGYESYICNGRHKDVPSSHSAIIVRHLSDPGSRYLVDIGAGVPFFRAVSLDFENVSPVYRDDYMTYRFVKEANGTITCQKILEEDHYWDLGSSHSKRSRKIGDWLPFMTYHPETRLDLETLVKIGTKLWDMQKVRPAMFHSILIIGFPNGRLCSISSTALYRATEGGRIKYTKLEGDGAIDAVFKYYPQFPRSMVEAAFVNSQNRQRQHKMNNLPRSTFSLGEYIQCH